MRTGLLNHEIPPPQALHEPYVRAYIATNGESPPTTFVCGANTKKVEQEPSSNVDADCFQHNSDFGTSYRRNIGKSLKPSHPDHLPTTLLVTFIASGKEMYMKLFSSQLNRLDSTPKK